MMNDLIHFWVVQKKQEFSISFLPSISADFVKRNFNQSKLLSFLSPVVEKGECNFFLLRSCSISCLYCSSPVSHTFIFFLGYLRLVCFSLSIFSSLLISFISVFYLAHYPDRSCWRLQFKYKKSIVVNSLSKACEFSPDIFSFLALFILCFLLPRLIKAEKFSQILFISF